ncbi:MAG: hypothetical protein ACOC2C_05585 [Cyclonatronaceae bacterium]
MTAFKNTLPIIFFLGATLTAGPAFQQQHKSPAISSSKARSFFMIFRIGLL